MGTRRPPKDTDQDQIDKAMNLILYIINRSNTHDEAIEPALWVSAMWRLIIDRYSDAITYEEFCFEMDNVTRHFKFLWDEKD